VTAVRDRKSLRANFRRAGGAPVLRAVEGLPGIEGLAGIAIPMRSRRACACSISSGGIVEGVAMPLPMRYANRSMWVLKQSAGAEPGRV
jgi:hypothetical protein